MKEYIETTVFRHDGALVRTRKVKEPGLTGNQEVADLAELMFGENNFGWDVYPDFRMVVGENMFGEEVHIHSMVYFDKIPVYEGTFVLGGEDGKTC